MGIHMFSYRKNNGNTGGSGGVNYKLMVANGEYVLIPDLRCYFKPQDSYNSIEKKDRFNFLRKIGLFDIYIKRRVLKRARKWMIQLNLLNNFDSEDVFIFHDIEAAYAFFHTHPDYKKTVLVYHQQGSLFDEWNAAFGINSISYKKYLNKLLAYVFDRSSVLCFPSLGAKDFLLKKNDRFSNILLNKKTLVLYNGVTIPQEIPTVINEQISHVIGRCKTSKGPILVSVSALNYAKGVDRIPHYLGKVKKEYPDFLWILIGNGNMEDTIRYGISKYNLVDNVIWVKEKVPNTDILNLLRHSHYYIMLHRWSIFDLATLEAMGSGNTPILSNTGGNTEVIIENNGFLIDHNDYDAVLRSIKTSFNRIEDYSRKNISIQERSFSLRAMLLNYKKLIDLFQ